MFRPHLLLLAFSFASTGFAAERPRLGVLIVIDQLSLDTFNARAPSMTGGIKRMVTEGVRFRECRYEAAPTITSVGHATLITGTYAEVHGIVANEWVDHETGKPVLSTEDPAYHIVGRPALRDGTAPTLLRAATLGDSVKLADARSKVVTISAKDRASILTAGRSADAAVWLDAELPMFTTSSFYAKEIPAWVKPTNDAIGKLIVSGAFVWGLPGGGITGANPMPPGGSKRAGEHELFAERPDLQPMLDTFEVDLAIAAVKAVPLGKDDAPDLLVVSFSGHDRTGHQFGPDSPESAAEFAVIDREIGRLLGELDKEVGVGRYVVALSSDHGVAPLPSFSKTRGLDSGHVDIKGLKEALEKEADQALGKNDWFGPNKTPGFYAASTSARARLHGIDERLRGVARKHPGVLDLLPLPAVLDGTLGGQVGELYRRGAVADRSPDFIVVLRPYWVGGLGDFTGHSSTYLYDRTVPLVFFGAGVKKGGSGDVAEPVDVAPTLSKLLSVPPPASSRGHVLDLSR